MAPAKNPNAKLHSLHSLHSETVETQNPNALIAFIALRNRGNAKSKCTHCIQKPSSVVGQSSQSISPCVFSSLVSLSTPISIWPIGTRMVAQPTTMPSTCQCHCSKTLPRKHLRQIGRSASMVDKLLTKTTLLQQSNANLAASRR